MSNRFIQLHSLISYPASLLNRDDAGFAKRIQFGDSARIRVSSQSLKRHWRQADGPYSLKVLNPGLSIRSRETFQRALIDPLLSEGLDQAQVKAIVGAMMSELLGESPKAKKKKKSGEAEAESAAQFKTSQVTVMGLPELEFLKGRVREIIEETENPKEAEKLTKAWLKKDAKKNLRALAVGMGLDAALFGRMVTSDILARCDAAIHVAHSMTVHQGNFETDYFSVVDDLEQADGKLGSGHINTAELTTGFFYNYVVIDTQLLRDNLNGDEKLTAEVIKRFVHLMATVSPGAKLGSTAPYAAAHLLMAEVGSAQPRTLANAFLKSIDVRDVVGNAYDALARHLGALDGMYGRTTTRRLSAIELNEGLTALTGEAIPLTELVEWLRSEVG